MKVLWIASNGTRYTLEADSMDKIQEKIAELREKNNHEKPDFMNLQINNPHANIDLSKITHVDELPEDLREQVKEVIEEGMAKPDPKTLN